MTTDSKLAEEKNKLTWLVFNATELKGKVKEWRVIQDAVRNILKTPASHIAENQEVQLAFSMLPLLGVPDLSYAHLQAVVQKFRANAQPDETTPIRAGLVDNMRNQPTPQANVLAVPVGSTTETIPTVKNSGHDVGNILQDINMFPGSPMPVTQPRQGLSITHEKQKQIIERREEDNSQEFGKRRRTSESDEADNILQRAAIPCGQCTLDDVECFKFAKPRRGRIRRACAHCNKKKRRCNFIPLPSRKNKKPSWNAVADREENFRWFPSGPSSSRVTQESSQLGDVTTRVIKVEDMVMDLQDQFKTMQEKVVVMDTRIEDLFESTKSVARVMKGFETRSEQANRMIEKLVERVERL